MLVSKTRGSRFESCRACDKDVALGRMGGVVKVFFTDRTDELQRDLADPSKAEKIKAVLAEMDEDDHTYLTARMEGFTDAAARSLVESLGQMRAAQKEES